MRKRIRRSGFTLMELIFVVVILGVMAGIVVPKILSNSQKSQLMSTIQSDARTIVEKVAEWKSNDPNAKGSYNNMSPASLSDYMPPNMPVENSTDTTAGDEAVIDSSGYGNTLVYKVKPDSDSTIRVAVDYSKIIKNDTDRKKYGRQIGNIFINLSQDKTNTSIDSTNDGSNGIVQINKIAP